MVERYKPPVASEATGGAYFSSPKQRGFIASGCKLLDMVLGGGWAEGRIANIIGDKSSGKTLLCIEASANFVKSHPKGKVYYREVEAAFDVDYAKALGMPVDKINFSHQRKDPIDTVEDMFEDMVSILNNHPKQPSLYILDSLDALSDREEVDRAMGAGSYGTGKSKKMSELFRRVVRALDRANMTVIIVSQVRSKIGVTFGDRSTRSGGRALDFYASQFLKLAHTGVIYETRHGQKRAVGISIKAKSTKNKIGLPFRECDFDLLFGYGVDDLEASVRWLAEVKGLDELGDDYRVQKPKKGEKAKANGVYPSVGALVDAIWRQPDDKFKEELSIIHAAVEKKWWSIEESLLPTRRKY